MDSDAPPAAKASSHHRAPPATKASSHHPVPPSSQGLFQPPPPHGQPGRIAASWTTKPSSHLPVPPSYQVISPMPPPPGHPGRTAVPSSQGLFQPPPSSWAAIVSSDRPVAPSSGRAMASSHRPVAPSSGRAMASSHRPVAPSPGRAMASPHRPFAPSRDMASPRPTVAYRGPAGPAPTTTSRGPARSTASQSTAPTFRPVAAYTPHRLMDIYDASAASKASSHRYPNWVMLDPHIRLNYHPKEDFLCAHAIAETSMGEHIEVSFRTVTPPGASRLYVRWTPRERTKGESSSGAGRGEDRFNGREPIVVAAHGNSILLQLTFENTQSDFFVYTLPASGPPSLVLLPSCNHKFIDCTHGSGWLDHMFRIKEIGLLCNAEQEKFVVVDLMILPSAYKDDDAPVVAELCVLQGSFSKDGWTTTPWRAIRPPIHNAKEQGKELMWWETDTVVPFRNSLSYVDYYRGIFFVDVLSRNPELHYVCLPVTTPEGDPADPETGLRGCPELYRSVCVTNDGCILKFVEVLTTTVFISGSRAPASSSFVINVWKLMQDSMRWEKEYVMNDTALWALQGCGDLLRVAPSFPLVSMEEPDVVYFVLSNRCFNDADASWVIVIDMLKKTMRSLSRYNKVYPNCIGSDDDMASASLATNSSFLPCAFSKYLRMRACVEPRG